MPEFGGAFVEGDTLYIWLTKPTAHLRDEVRAALKDAETGLTAPSVRALKADFTFTELEQWRGAASDVLSIDGAVYTDVNERTNRFEIGVEDPSAQRAAVEAVLEFSSVPLAAVTVVKTSPIEFVPPVRTGGVLRWIALTGLVLLAIVAVLRRGRRARRLRRTVRPV